MRNFRFDVTEAELRQFFEDSNPSNVKIIVDLATQRSKGFGFVTFDSQNDLENALQVCNTKNELIFYSIFQIINEYFLETQHRFSRTSN